MTIDPRTDDEPAPDNELPPEPEPETEPEPEPRDAIVVMTAQQLREWCVNLTVHPVALGDQPVMVKLDATTIVPIVGISWSPGAPLYLLASIA